MPSPVAVPKTLILDGLPTDNTLVRIAGCNVAHVGGQLQSGWCVVLSPGGLKVAQIVEKMVETFRAAAFLLGPQCTLEADANQEFEIMGKTCDEGQQLLRDTEFVSSVVLCLGK